MKSSAGERKIEPNGREEVTFEPSILGKAKVWLPVPLIEDSAIFQSVLSQETWDTVLTEADRKKLSQLLPTFPEDDEKEKQESLRKLFEEENFRFGNPLVAFRERLRAGFMHPEISEMEKSLRKAAYQDYKYTQQRRLHRLLKEVLISRQELLEAAIFTSPIGPVPVKRRLYRNDKAVDDAVQKKYRKMLATSRDSDSTPDSSDSEDNRMELNGFHTSPIRPSPAAERSLDALLEPRWTDFWPREFDAQDDFKTHSTFDLKPAFPDGQTPGKSPQPTKPPTSVHLTQQHYIKLIEDYQDRLEDEHLRKHPELNTKNITLSDIISRAFPLPPPPATAAAGVTPKPEDSPLKTGKKRKEKEKDKKRRKKKKITSPIILAPTLPPPKSTTPVSTGTLDESSPVDIMSTPESRSSTRDDLSTSPATCSPASAGSSLFTEVWKLTRSSDIKPPLRVHPSFFSLLRDIFTAAPGHRLTLARLRESLASWQRSPVSMLSTWAVLQPSWAKVVDGAMRFLTGEIPVNPEVVARVRFDEERQMWQWKSELPPDSEEELVTLFKQWLDTLPGMRAVPVQSTDDGSGINPPTTFTPVTQIPAFNTSLSFSEQERDRFSQPHKAYVYCLLGVNYVVGPVKGVFGKETALNKAREHALLISDRPSYVTILSLVRDAVARLPNGEGTRAAVCDLLRESQYLADSSESQINNVVSGALDRLHYEKDPCIRYDVNRKLWVYLHRERTKDEFERIHQEQAAEYRARKTVARQTKLLPKIAPGLRESPISFTVTRPSSVVSDTSSESLSIEVCSPIQSPGRAGSPKTSRKSPAAFLKSSGLARFQGQGDRPITVTSISRPDFQGTPSSVAMVSSSGRLIPGTVLGQSPFVISPHKMGTLQSALRGLHQNPAMMPNTTSDSFIKAQLLASKAADGSFGSLGLAAGAPASQQGSLSSSAANLLKGITGLTGEAGANIPMSNVELQAEVLRNLPAFQKSMSVPCTLPDGKVVMISPEMLISGGKATKKRARSGSGGRKKGNLAQINEATPAASGAETTLKTTTTSDVSPSSVTLTPGAGKGGKKGGTAPPSPLTIGANKLATVSEALAQKRAQQSRGPSTITLPPGALKGQTVKSILASVGIPLSGASVTVSRIDTPAASTSGGKQASGKSKDSRKSPVYSSAGLGSQQAAKGRSSSSPSTSGKKSPITSMHPAAFSHQTIGLTTVTKGGQIVVQPVALGIDRPGSAASPGMAGQSSNAGPQALTIKAIPVSLTKQQVGAEASRASHGELTLGLQTRKAPDEHAAPRKGKAGKGGASKQHFLTGNAAAALAAQAGKMSGGADLKDFASVPLSVLLPGARQGNVAGAQKGSMPVLTSPFLAGGQIPLTSLTDGKGNVIFQMPHGSNLMSLPMSGVPMGHQKPADPAGQMPTSTTVVTTRAGPSHRAPTQGQRQQNPAHMQLPSGTAAPQTHPSPSRQQPKMTSPVPPPNVVTATIRSALAAAQSRSNQAQQRASPAYLQSGGHVVYNQQPSSASAAMKLGAQSAARLSSPGLFHQQLNSPSSTVSSAAHGTSPAGRPRTHVSVPDTKTSSLTASSIASIIANLKQNPMAAISLPTVPSYSQAPPTSLSRTLSHPSGTLAPPTSRGFMRPPNPGQFQQERTAALPSQFQQALSSSEGPASALMRSLSQPSVSASSSPSHDFTRIPTPVSASSRSSPVQTSASPNVARSLSQSPTARRDSAQTTTVKSQQQTKVVVTSQPALPPHQARTVASQSTMQQPQQLTTTTPASAATTQPQPKAPAVSAAPQRIIPPFEPRVTRGQTKGKEKPERKDSKE